MTLRTKSTLDSIHHITALAFHYTQNQASCQAKFSCSLTYSTERSVILLKSSSSFTHLDHCDIYQALITIIYKQLSYRLWITTAFCNFCDFDSYLPQTFQSICAFSSLFFRILEGLLDLKAFNKKCFRETNSFIFCKGLLKHLYFLNNQALWLQILHIHCSVLL